MPGVEEKRKPPVHELVEPDVRVFFAAERTFLAWLRTGLSLMGFGFIVARFGVFLREMAVIRGEPLPAEYSRWFGISLVTLGVALMAGAIAEHFATVRRLRRGEPIATWPSWLALIAGSLVLMLGAAMAVYLFVEG